VLSFLGSQATDESIAAASAPPATSPTGWRARMTEGAPRKTPMDLRIERHMALVDRALIQINSLNPQHKKWFELPPGARESIAQQERTIHEIVNAKLYFWAATIRNSPLGKFDETERSWIARMIRLARIVGVDPGRRDCLAFLKV
jgi:hypothetical protein